MSRGNLFLLVFVQRNQYSGSPLQPSLRGKFAQRGQQPVYFFPRVVVHQPDAQNAAKLLQAQPIRQIDGVEISVPRENPAISKERRDFCGIMISQSKRKCRTAFAKSLWIGDSKNLNSGDRLQPLNQFRN